MVGNSILGSIVQVESASPARIRSDRSHSIRPINKTHAAVHWLASVSGFGWDNDSGLGLGRGLPSFVEIDASVLRAVPAFAGEFGSEAEVDLG